MILGNCSVANILQKRCENKCLFIIFNSDSSNRTQKSKPPRTERNGLPLIFVQKLCYAKATVSPAITIDTIDISFMRMLSDGPLVSLNGSPTVSPTTVAL